MSDRTLLMVGIRVDELAHDLKTDGADLLELLAAVADIGDLDALVAEAASAYAGSAAHQEVLPFLRRLTEALDPVAAVVDALTGGADQGAAAKSGEVAL